LITKLQLTGKAHGDGERLWVVDLDIEAEQQLQSCREDLYLLHLHEGARAREEGLEAVVVVDDVSARLGGWSAGEDRSGGAGARQSGAMAVCLRPVEPG